VVPRNSRNFQGEEGDPEKIFLLRKARDPRGKKGSVDGLALSHA